jgi:hypothetical protein
MVVHLSFSFSAHSGAPKHAWHRGGCGAVPRRSTTGTANPLRRSTSGAATSLSMQLLTLLQPPVIARAVDHPFTNLSWLPELIASALPRLPLSAHPEGKSGGGGTQRGGSVLQRSGGAVDSSEMIESMVFVAAVLCTTRVMDMGMIFYP